MRIRNGERVDLLIMVNNGMNELITGGYFKPLDRKGVAVSKIGIAVKKGHPQPEIATVPALRKALLDAQSIGHSEGASGSYIASVLLKKNLGGSCRSCDRIPVPVTAPADPLQSRGANRSVQGSGAHR